MSPDLDQPATYGQHILGTQAPMIGALWQLYWRPYRKMVPHRHWVSHAPFVGTIIRLYYLLFPFLLIVSFLGVDLTQKTWPVDLGWLLIGLSFSDFIHWIRDSLV